MSYRNEPIWDTRHVFCFFNLISTRVFFFKTMQCKIYSCYQKRSSVISILCEKSVHYCVFCTTNCILKTKTTRYNFNGTSPTVISVLKKYFRFRHNICKRRNGGAILIHCVHDCNYTKRFSISSASRSNTTLVV